MAFRLTHVLRSFQKINDQCLGYSSLRILVHNIDYYKFEFGSIYMYAKPNKTILSTTGDKYLATFRENFAMVNAKYVTFPFEFQTIHKTEKDFYKAFVDVASQLGIKNETDEKYFGLS